MLLLSSRIYEAISSGCNGRDDFRWDATYCAFFLLAHHRPATLSQRRYKTISEDILLKENRQKLQLQRDFAGQSVLYAQWKSCCKFQTNRRKNEINLACVSLAYSADWRHFFWYAIIRSIHDVCRKSLWSVTLLMFEYENLSYCLKMFANKARKDRTWWCAITHDK